MRETSPGHALTAKARRATCADTATLRRRVDLMTSFNVQAVAGSAMLAATIAFATPAQAAFQGLSVFNHTTVNIGGTNRTVYRVYANFSNPADQVNLVYGSPTLGTMFLQSRNADDSAPGSNFANPGG